MRTASMNTTMTAVELGALLGISDRAVRDLAKAGHVVSTSRGKYDVAASVPKYCAHLRSLAVGRGGEAAQATAARERARLARAQADLAETMAPTWRAARCRRG
jgi:phage terminase Nu1 subunit (DNA packaging protein)